MKAPVDSRYFVRSPADCSITGYVGPKIAEFVAWNSATAGWWPHDNVGIAGP